MGDYTYFLGVALARAGSEVHVVTSLGELDEALYPPCHGLHVHRVVRSWGWHGVAKVVKAIHSLKPDALVIQYTPHAYDKRGITLAVNLLPLLLRWATRTRVVVNFHETFIPFDHSLKHWFGSLWQRAMAFVIAAPSHVIMAISSEWPDRLRSVGIWKPIHVVPVGSNIPRVDVSAEERAVIRKRLGVDESILLVGSFGSAGVDRDTKHLLEALAKLRQECSVRLVWLGKTGLDGSDSAKGWQDWVSWTGPLPHPDVSRALSACDVFVLPFVDGVTTKRGTLAAALLHGMPVLTTKGSRLDSFFVHGENVYLVPLSDPEALEGGLRQLARQPDVRARLRMGARELYERQFDWDVVARRVARWATT